MSPECLIAAPLASRAEILPADPGNAERRGGACVLRETRGRSRRPPADDHGARTLCAQRRAHPYRQPDQGGHGSALFQQSLGGGGRALAAAALADRPDRHDRRLAAPEREERSTARRPRLGPRIRRRDRKAERANLAEGVASRYPRGGAHFCPQFEVFQRVECTILSGADCRPAPLCSRGPSS